MKFKIGDRIFLNDPANTQHGRAGTVVNVKRRGYPYEIMMDGDEHRINDKPFTWWEQESKLSLTPVPRVDPEPMKSTLTIRFESMDISSGFGIGGHGSDDHDMKFETDRGSNVRPGCQWKHGTRYEENCEKCGRFSFEICNDCGCCGRCHHFHGE